MNIFEFLPAKQAESIREHGYTLSSLEMAAIIERSGESIDKKHRAYAEIIESYPDYPDSEFPKKLKYRPKGGLHNYLRELIKWEKKTIADFADFALADESSKFELYEDSVDEKRILIEKGDSLKSVQAAAHRCNLDSPTMADVVVVRTIGDPWKHCYTATLSREGEITSICTVHFDDERNLLDDNFPYGLYHVDVRPEGSYMNTQHDLSIFKKVHPSRVMGTPHSILSKYTIEELRAKWIREGHLDPD